MKSLTDLSNRGKTLVDKLNMIEIKNEQDLKEIGSKNVIIKLRHLEKAVLV